MKTKYLQVPTRAEILHRLNELKRKRDFIVYRNISTVEKVLNKKIFLIRYN